MFHIGHLLLIQRAAKRCRHLIVGVVSDEFNLHNKKRLPCIPYEDRAAIVGAIEGVAEVVRVEHRQSVIDTWEKHPYDCYFSGDDHVGADFTRDMEKHGIEVAFFPYTQKISSTKLREQIGGSEGEATSLRKEVLFLPYKASMWDSMESVWQAVCRDEDCHAVVMPIPYADLNADGSVRRWNCERDKFPDYVPTVDWQSYDLARQKPAVIYIHNPYDDGNRITMVESEFFSRNLRKYTDMLVYIPYFAWTGVWPGNHLNLPCYEQVDKIIVQSPCYRVSGNGWYEGDKANLEDVMPAGKVKVLGSPKIDRMLQAAQNYALPDGWQEKLGRKKTVFYNTTVSPLMAYGKRGMKKMWQVYHTMRKKPDMSFIWRPHPLLEGMLESQRPELLEEYRKWKTAMQSLPQVIYDDTADLERSVAISDGYIGEYSSVAQLFASLGKPIFYNDMLLGPAEDDAEYHLAGQFMLVDEDVIYFWADYWNALCQMHLDNGTVEVLYQKQPSGFSVGNYACLFKIGTHLVLTPNNAGKILDYNLQTRTAVEVPLIAPLETGNLRYGIVYGEMVIMLGFRYESIIAYEPASSVIETLCRIPKEILDKRSESHEFLLGKPCLMANVLYVPVINANQILSLDLVSRKCQIYTVGPEEAGYGYATAYAGNIWLAPWLGGPLTVWNPPTGVMQVFDQFPHDFSFSNLPGIDETQFFRETVACGHYWWLLPMKANMVLRLDMETGEVKAVDMGFPLDAPQNEHYQQLQYVWCGDAMDGLVYIWTGADRKIHCLQNETGEEVAVYSPQMPADEAQQIRHELGREDFYEVYVWGQVAAIFEDGISRTPEAFFDYVKSGRHDGRWQQEAFCKITANGDGSCGEKIHQYVMSELTAKRGE
ncbi:cytidyltransferase-like domain-containing protein [Selenomonas ruminantium]|uniref:Cytidyltransferase-like domain-containing protein n=2 Tax=Selenomonas ruminantium TaxID=971 RepID=A0A1I0YEY2_SELRU|nr:cytidyltransferase-like domain-containing protein [Selenomonas ruminantium]